MRRRGVSRLGITCRRVAIGFWVLAFFVSSRSRADDARESARPDEGGGEVFRLDRVWRLHITVAPDEYAAMQPIVRAGLPGSPGGPLAKAVAKRDANRASERNLMGVEFPWAEGELVANGTGFAKVAIRYSGEASYQAAASRLKRDLVIHLAGKATWGGLTTFILHSGVLDPTKARETIAYSLCRAAGVAAPRTAFAEVTLTVPGKYDHEHLGLYTLIEPIDERFLSDRFQALGGVLLKKPCLRFPSALPHPGLLRNLKS
jgi:spore coat protein H